MYHRVIRSCSVEFDVTLTLSIVRSLFTGNVLKLWRMTDLCPIFKQGSKLWDSKLETGVTYIGGLENDRKFCSRRDNELLRRDWSCFSEPARFCLYKELYHKSS